MIEITLKLTPENLAGVMRHVERSLGDRSTLHRVHLARQELINAAIEEFIQSLDMEGGDEPACRVCGCTEEKACSNVCGEPCHWVEADLCSACFAGHGAHKLTQAMLRQLKDAAADPGSRGRKFHVTRALRSRGLLDQANTLTAAGKLVCWDCGFLPYSELRAQKPDSGVESGASRTPRQGFGSEPNNRSGHDEQERDVEAESAEGGAGGESDRRERTESPGRRAAAGGVG